MRLETKNKKSVLIITERFYPEEFGINELAKDWKNKGYAVSVLTQAPSYPFDVIYKGYRNKIFQTEKWDGITIYRIFSLLGYKKNVWFKVMNYLFFAFFSTMAVLIAGRKVDSIFVYHIGPLTQAVPALFIKKILKKRFYIWTLDIWPDSVYAYGFKKKKIFTKMLDWFVATVYRNCDTAFISCEGFKQKIEKYASGVRIIFAPQWAPDDLEFTDVTSHELLKDGFNFTFAGNIGKVQNLENVIKGFALASEVYPQMNLNIIGDGSNLEVLKDMVARERIKHVYFWGRRPLKEMPAWFEGSDALIISLIDKPIFSLTVPAKFQAYLASGKPIFCVMKGEVANLVKTNGLGVVSHPATIDDIKSGFEQFMKIPGQGLKNFGQNMQLLLNREYDRHTITSRMAKEIFI